MRCKSWPVLVLLFRSGVARARDHDRVLDVYFRDTKAAYSAGLTTAADFCLRWARISWTNDRRAISFSMPLQEEPFVIRWVRPFSPVSCRTKARATPSWRVGLSAGNAFGLLEVIGANAQVPCHSIPPARRPNLPASPKPKFSLRNVWMKFSAGCGPGLLLGGDEAFAYRFAGAQDKLAVIVDGGSIAVAKDGRPTTHILKPVIQAFEGTVENEYFCMRLLRASRLPVPHVEIRLDGATAFLLVERYDRTKAADGIIERLHRKTFARPLASRRS